jgi:hypothetical protein
MTSTMPEQDLREIISTRHAPDGRAARRSADKAMLAEVSAVVRAPKQTVSAVYAAYQDWPGLFPTISRVRLISRDGPRLALEVNHVEDTVLNERILRCPDEIDLWEIKRRYDACFRNRFVAIPEGTLFVVTGEIWLKGWARLLRPFLTGYIRRQMRRLQLRPVQARAEAQAQRPGQGDDQRWTAGPGAA